MAKLTPDELAERIAAGGRAGAKQSAIVRRARRKRYLESRMNDFEKEDYERLLAKRRRAAKMGGAARAKQMLAKRQADKLAAKSKPVDHSPLTTTTTASDDPQGDN